MRIENFRTEIKNGFARLSATLIWEDRARSGEEIYIETLDRFSGDLLSSPEPFLIAASIAAMFYGEKRISINSEICPELKQGLAESICWLQHWLLKPKDSFQIEAPVYSFPVNKFLAPRTGAFFTGGVDSWANLRFNQLNYPSTHSGSIKDCIVVYGLQNYGRQNFENAFQSFQDISESVGINFIPVYTNIYAHLTDLDQDYRFWKKAFNGAALAAIGHAFGNRFTKVVISSGNDIPNLAPHGTHPLLDTNYSSEVLRIRHDGVTLSRLDKTKLIAEWPLALNNLKVCDENHIPEDYLNCGKCEKCLITMTTLVAIDAPDTKNVFPFEVTEDTFKRYGYITHDGNKDVLSSLRPLLVAKDRHDLVSGIDLLIKRYDERDWKGRLKIFDRRFLGGKIELARKKTTSWNNFMDLADN